MNGTSSRGYANETGGLQTKIIFLIVSSILLILFFAYYLFRLQIVDTQIYSQRAHQVSTRIIPLPAERGEIFDRNCDIPLVQNIPSFAINIIPGDVSDEELDIIFRKLSGVLGIDEDQMRERIPPNYRHLFVPVEVASGIQYEKIIIIAENIDDYPGVTWINKSIRHYVDINSVSHVIGYVGNISREEFHILYNQGYDLNAQIGKSGIEKQYDKILRGEDGRSLRVVDATGRFIESSEAEVYEPGMGNNLVLTIDRKIQLLCEKALGDRIGSVVVMRPQNGEVLAMVSYPWYNPNEFYEQNAAHVFKELSLDQRNPFLNRSIQAAYAPASTYKIVLTTAAIEEHLIGWDETIECLGVKQFGNREFLCWVEAKGQVHGKLNLKNALAQSCNIFFYTLGSEYVGAERIIDYSYRFGYGQKTGIDLMGEIPGLVPTPQWKEMTYNSIWVGGDTINMSIGQGFLLVTPIQCAVAMSFIANSGIAYKPHILREIRDPITNAVIESIKPEIIFESNMEDSTFAILQEFLRYVIVEGTPKSVITTSAVSVAGKTGTGEVYAKDTDRWTSWFISYAPYEGPPEDQVVVVVNVEASNDWEWWAPKAANIIFQGIFAHETYDEAVKSLNVWYMR